MQKVSQVLGADLADRRADAQIAPQQADVAGEGLDRVDREPFVLHVALERAQRRLQRRFARQQWRAALAVVLAHEVGE